jgi:hypothetical protein
VAIALGIALVGLTVVLLTPRSCTVEDGVLVVRTRLLRYRFDLQDAVAVQEIEPYQIGRWSTVRLFGVGWPLKPFGWFATAGLGTYLSLVNNSSRMCLVQFQRRQLLVSPAGGATEIASALRR